MTSWEDVDEDEARDGQATVSASKARKAREVEQRDLEAHRERVGPALASSRPNTLHGRPRTTGRPKAKAVLRLWTDVPWAMGLFEGIYLEKL